jgi:Uma2 family endonuclease
MWDLPSEEVGEPALPDEFHRLQSDFAEETCQPPTYPADQIFIGCDLYLYYDSRHTLWYKRPDWFLALGVPRSTHQQEMRLSYVTWQEGVAPFMVMELLSPGTEDEDLGQTLRDVNKPPTKWQVYEQILKVPYYVVYDRYINHLRIFRLDGGRYRELDLPNQRLWIEELQLGLGLWQGSYEGITGLWLRWYDINNQWIPTAAERAEFERQRAEQAQQQAEQAQQQAEQAQQQAEEERQRAEAEHQRAERLAEFLRSQGIDPSNL